MERDNTEQQKQTQTYDSTFKDLVQQQVAAILPQLLPGVTYQGTLNVELIRPAVRSDKVYTVSYRQMKHIFHVEFETGNDQHMEARLLAYNAMLYRDHKLPVISMIVYPFRTTMAESPLRITSGDEDLVTFHFKMLPLFTMNAEYYVQEHILCMYPLVPTMLNVDHELIKQVMDELAALYREDEVTLAQQFVWMKLLLDRTSTISLDEKGKIQEVLNMYDKLWDENPRVQQIRAESLAKGIEKGELKARKELLITLVSTRFPAFAELAQKRTDRVSSSSDLDLLYRQLLLASDEQMAQRLLTLPE